MKHHIDGLSGPDRARLGEEFDSTLKRWARARASAVAQPDTASGYDPAELSNMATQRATAGRVHSDAGQIVNADTGLRFESRADAARHARDMAADYGAWWRLASDPCGVLARELSSIGKAAGKLAAGRLGAVSRTSRDEAAAVGRAAVVQLLAHVGKGHVDAGRGLDQLHRPAFARFARLVARRAAVRSLVGDLTGGQTGDTAALWRLRREPFTAKLRETLDNIVRAGFNADTDTVTRSRARALFCVRAVRAVMRSRLAGQLPCNRARFIGRYRRIARVLALVAQGESLALSITAGGFGSLDAWGLALRQSGVKDALCVHVRA